MHLQRLLMPDGRVSWTAYDGDAAVVVEEIRAFVVHLESLRYAPSTVHHYVRHVVRLGNYLAGAGKRFEDLTPMDFDRFIPAAAKSGTELDSLAAAMNIIPLRTDYAEVSASLHNQILFAIKAFYQFRAIGHAALASIPKGAHGHSPPAYKPFLEHILTRKARRPRESRSDKTAQAASAKRAATHRLKPEQVLQIIEAATTMRDAFLVVLLYVTGMRIGEARGLLHEDFRLDENVVWVTPRTLENGARVKSGKPRPIPVPEFIMRMYEDYIASDEYLPAFETGTDFVFCNIFSGRVGRGLAQSNVYEIQTSLVRRSRVSFSWHKFRHTHASEAIAQGYSLLDVADRLGHRSTQTTNAVYKHLFNAEYRKMMLQTHIDLERKLEQIYRRQGLTEEQFKWL